MKKYFRTLIPCLLAYTVAHNTHAQCDNAYYEYRDGTSMEMTSYDDKGKVNGYSNFTYTNFESSGNHTQATVKLILKDKKGKPSYEGEYYVHCEEGTIKYELTAMMANAVAGLENMEFEVESEDLEIPPSLNVGQKLKGASMTMKIVNMPIPMNYETIITNRKVDANETITTPAGTFDCVKITFDSEFRMMGRSVNKSKNTMWLAKKAGTIKTAFYKANGDLQGYQELTSFKE